MRRSPPSAALPGPPLAEPQAWKTIKSLLPYLLAWKGRVAFALACLICAKLANVAVPLIFKDIIDTLGVPADKAMLLAPPQDLRVLVPLGLVAAYGALRFSTSLFTELRELIFARVTQRAVRTISLQVFEHLHALSLRFHLERQTGGLTRDIERGTRAISSLISYTLYSILPTLVEISLVLGILLFKYEISFALITVGALIIYIVLTITITNW
ncbi:MAG: metal ABC transporter permease, partial [Betaproteobacteria bacterium]|nr:metal ABC transporter permease [Betaproteobacteria bacterium]